MTAPVEEPMSATPVLLLVHVPPSVVSVNVVLVPVQTANVPPIGLGSGSTVTTLALEHPVVVCVNVIADVPAPMPLIMPEPDPTVATEVLEEAQVPAALTHVIVEPAHTEDGPVDADGSAFTVIVVNVVALPHALDIV